MGKIAVAVFALLFGMLGYAIVASQGQTEQYSKVCAEVGGKAVFNGKYLECLK
jgi:hypothetical protein